MIRNTMVSCMDELACPPSPIYVYVYCYISTPNPYRTDIGIFEALRKLEYTCCRPLFGLSLAMEYPKLCYRYPACALDHEHGSDVANEALIFSRFFTSLSEILHPHPPPFL